ncbi:hypothetical protein GOBAR_DD12755 [Gossypium barbadense]|nr:hypothetical protein GOBAR_DD12755 [Gossypium barbadense]
MEEEFALLDGDVVTEVVDGVSSITFSNRVQEYIVYKMCSSGTVRVASSECRSEEAYGVKSANQWKMLMERRQKGKGQFSGTGKNDVSGENGGDSRFSKLVEIERKDSAKIGGNNGGEYGV